MRKKFVVGNWKMNKTLKEGIDLTKRLESALKEEKVNCEIIICPPFIHLASIVERVNTQVIKLGAQNHADKSSGSYTGEVSASMISSMGVEYVILGHSERRIYYKETNITLKEKVKQALENCLRPIFCVGEILEERENGKQNEVVKTQIEESIFNLFAEDFKKIILAYEPVWAIGTGRTATPAQAQEMHAFIRKILTDKYGYFIAQEVSILYGGSCHDGNAKELFDNLDVDGGLIGGASLSVKTFLPIIKAFD